MSCVVVDSGVWCWCWLQLVKLVGGAGEAGEAALLCEAAELSCGL